MITLKNGDLSLTLNETGACVAALRLGDVLVADRGIIVGRYGNRIGGAKFTIDGREYLLTKNDGNNQLHGGFLGFSKKQWAVLSQGENEAVLRMESPDGEEGFPGNLTLDVKYSLSPDTMTIEYSAVCDKDCHVNFTNHSYFNLNGGGSAEDHILYVDADRYTPVSPDLIPSGELAPVDGTVFDFRTPRQYKRHLDHNLCLNHPGEGIAATLEGCRTGFKLIIRTTEPGVQVFDTEDRICLEAEHYPDSPNHSHFPSTLLRAGERFYSKTSYQFVRP